MYQIEFVLKSNARNARVPVQVFCPIQRRQSCFESPNNKQPTYEQWQSPEFPNVALAPQIHFRITPLPTPKLTQALNCATSGPQVSFVVVLWHLCETSGVLDSAGFQKKHHSQKSNICQAISHGKTLRFGSSNSDCATVTSLTLRPWLSCLPSCRDSWVFPDRSMISLWDILSLAASLLLCSVRSKDRITRPLWESGKDQCPNLKIMPWLHKYACYWAKRSHVRFLLVSWLIFSNKDQGHFLFQFLRWGYLYCLTEVWQWHGVSALRSNVKNFEGVWASTDVIGGNDNSVDVFWRRW